MAWDQAKKRNVINAGRRGGKTFFLAARAVFEAFSGKQVLYGAPTTVQTDSFWGYCTSWLAPKVERQEIDKLETTRKLMFEGGGVIHARTCWDIDTWRGGYGDVVILDEYAYQRDDPWGAVVQPMLLDNNGDAYFGSTPNRRNHHYRRYVEAMDHPERWACITFPSTDNPHLSAEALAQLTEDMTEDDYRQEIMAEFLPGHGTVFTIGSNNLWVPDHAHDGHKLVMALDLAKVQDFTAISVACVTHKKELALIRMKGPAQQQAADIMAIWKRYHKPLTWIEDNAAVDIIKALADAKMSFELVHTDQNTKPEMIAALKLALEQGDWQFVDDRVGTMELEAFEEDQTRTGRMTFGTQSAHDDTVMSRAIMVWSVNRNPFPFAVA